MPSLVVLAAGASARLGRCKALAPLNGVTAIDRILSGAAGSSDDLPLIVSGPDHGWIAAHVGERAVVAENPKWTAGRTGSLARGAELRPGRDLLVAPVDCPAVPASVFRAMAAAWSENGSPDQGWLAPRYGPDGYGHPVLIGRRLALKLISMDPDRPLRELREQALVLLDVEVESPAVLEDLDTPEDLAQIETRLRAEES